MNSPKSLFNAIHTKERGRGKFVKPNFHAPCANSVSYQSVITQRPNTRRRTSCRNCFGVGRVHIRPDALRFQLHCCRRLSRRAWSTLQCGKAWWLVPCMVFCYSCVVICLKWLFNEYFLAILNKQSALVAAYTATRQVVSLGRTLVAAIEVDYASHRFIAYHL